MRTQPSLWTSALTAALALAATPTHGTRQVGFTAAATAVGAQAAAWASGSGPVAAASPTLSHAQGPPAPPARRPPGSSEAGGTPGETFTERLSRVLEVGEEVTVVAHNFSGDIRVSTGKAREVRIDAIRRPATRGGIPGPDTPVNIVIEQRDNRVEVRLPRPRHALDRRGMPTADLQLVIPPTAAVDLRSVSGDLTVRGPVRGTVFAETVRGDIEISGLAGPGTVRSVSGDVTLAASTLAADLTVNNVSGAVTLTDVRARTLTLATVSGDVCVANCRVDRAVLKSVSGTLEVRGPLAKGARYELTSHSGDVRLALDGRTGFELDASTWSGSVASELPLRRTGTGGTNAEDGRPPRSLQGVYGDGSARIEVGSFSGSVRIVPLK